MADFIRHFFLVELILSKANLKPKVEQGKTQAETFPIESTPRAPPDAAAPTAVPPPAAPPSASAAADADADAAAGPPSARPPAPAPLPRAGGLRTAGGQAADVRGVPQDAAGAREGHDEVATAAAAGGGEQAAATATGTLFSAVARVTLPCDKNLIF